MTTGEEFLEYYFSWAGPAGRAYAAALGAQLPPAAGAAEQVLVCGMGGSGVAGDYAAAMAEDYGGAPVYVAKAPEPPAWVDGRTLVVAVSFSGNTRETLECAARSLRRGAIVVAVTSGGKLSSWARRSGQPLLLVEEAPAPRAGLPQLFYTVLGLLEGLGLLRVPRWDVEESIALLKRREEAEREARELAAWLQGARQPIIVAAPEPYSALAVRTRSELAENAKMLGLEAVLPEAGHNLLEALAAGGAYDLLLLDPGEEPWSRLLHEAAGLVRASSIHSLRMRGSTGLQRLIVGSQVVGAATVMAAIGRGVDPVSLTAVKAFRRVVESSTEWGRGREY